MSDTECLKSQNTKSLGNSSTCGSYSFHRVKNGTDLLPVLQERLPISGTIYNMVLIHPRFREEVEFYTFGNSATISESSWVISIYRRENSGIDVQISTSTSSQVIISEDVEAAFRNSPIFDWSTSHCFGTHEPGISAMLLQLSKSSVKKMRGVLGANPCTLYFFPHKEVLVPNIEAGVRVGDLNSDSGFQFVRRTWKFAKYSSSEYIRKILTRNPSKGVWADGKLASGMTLGWNGAMTMLYTEPEVRGRGYGTLTMSSLIQNILESDLLPLSLVEPDNSASNQFHQSIGMKYSHTILFNYFNGLSQ